MILSVHHISKAFLEKQVLSDVTFHLEKGDRAAIVGINGAGKSTLLKIIIGEETPDEGTVAISREATWGYLAQTQNLTTDHTIYEELLTVKKDVVEMEQKLAADEKLMEKLTGKELEDLVTEYNDLLHRYQQENGYAYKGEITGVLRGLGFAEEEFTQKISTLSGGQKTRVALAKLLLEKPDILMLDEPTNHLDIGSIRWLETYLSNYRGTVLVVSHDRYFLDRTVTKIIEIENCRAIEFPGNYSWYAERKKALREEQRHQYLNNQAQIKHQEEVIAKLRQFNREKSIKRAESREKMLNKMERVEKPIEIRDDMNLTFRPCIRSGRDVMEVRHLSKSFDNKLLFRDISYDIHRGEHVAIIGNNGTGKSTMLKMIMGQVKPDEGAIRFGTNVHIGYYDQEHHVLHDDNTLFEEIADEHPDMNNTEIRSLLASFLFTGEDVFKYIRDLSGGEKGRVSLAKLMLSEANFLILDEPTNHLDMVSKEVLENALNHYEGTVLYVSHDRYFINHTASRILSLTKKLMLDYPGHGGDEAPAKYIGNYDFYLEKSAQVEDSLISQEKKRVNEETGGGYQEETFAPSGKAQETPFDGADSWQRQKEEQKEQRKLANALKKVEDRISVLEKENADIDERMADPAIGTDLPKLEDLQKKKDANDEELSGLYDQWEKLQS
ncbi:MAG: ABC-F family ATP-binding cassette domain-containing protein [Lachnospiraceae bacterium]|nr:ABC-F family ATP-binding cassette domain-containing protein [Lachnospiraceae bacterium]